MLHGLDLSNWQRSTPSLAGMSFLWVKATEGLSFVDPMDATHTAAARTAGIVRGAYHFGHTGLDLDTGVTERHKASGGRA